MSNGVVHVNLTDESNYRLSGNIEQLTQNPRAIISLKRLSHKVELNTILIPFEETTRVVTLEAIQDMCDKFELSAVVSSGVNQTVHSYKIEQDHFRSFTQLAKSIRNDEFNSYPGLVKDFALFKDVLAKNMVRNLYDLQFLSAFHMAFSQNSCNFAVPGAGKTSIVYGAYTYLKNLPEDDAKHVDKLLVIGPLSSFAPWEKEYEKCFGREADSQRLSGDAKISTSEKEHHLYSDSPKELTLVSHAGLQYLSTQLTDYLKLNRVLVVVDEAHRIKNADGIWGQRATELAKDAAGRIVLTGTPAPNGYEDLYNLFKFIYPYKYKEIMGIHWGQLKELSKTEASLENPRVAAFVENIKPYFIRIKKSDLKLPPAEETVRPVIMSESQRKIYSFIEARYISHFSRNVSATTKDVLNKARLIRLRQAASNPALLLKPLTEALESSQDGSDPNYAHADSYDESIDDSEIFREISSYAQTSKPEKFITINEILSKDILPNGGKAIIWTIFIQNAEGLQAYLSSQGITSRLLIGKVPQPDREVIIDAFNDPDNHDFQVVIANPFSVSESISLHEGCHNAIYMERDYNAANFLQSKDRIHRVGLKPDTVTRYYYLVTTDSIDEVIHRCLNVKINRMEQVINQDIPLLRRVHDEDDTDIIKGLLVDYANRS